MTHDHRPDRPVPPYDNQRPGDSTSRSGSPRPVFNPRPDQERPQEPRPNRPRPSDQGTSYNPRHNRLRPDIPNSYDPRRAGPAPYQPRPTYSPAPSPPRPSDPRPRDPRPRDSEPGRPFPDDPAWPDGDLAWPGDDAAWPGDPGADSPWADDSTAHGTGSGSGSGEKRPSRSKSDALKRSSSMRSALMVVGVLGAVVVLAVGLVALTVLRGGSNGTAAANVTNATAGASASGTASASHSATASPKAKAKSATKKTAATSGTKPATALLTVPAGWKLAFDPSFSGTQLSTGTWATCYDWATSPSVGCTNNPTKEKEWYVPSQVNVSGGAPNLVAKQESTQGTSSSGAAQTYTCRSGMVTSKPGFNF